MALQLLEFNVLGQERYHQQAVLGDVAQWPHNRIGHSAGVIYHYDAWGNRVEAIDGQGVIRRFHYDALHRLIEAETLTPRPGAADACVRARYRYDAFGRRLAKTRVDESGSRTTWYGWDTDRLVRTEDEISVRHTVYEPQSFIPLVELARAKGAPGAMPTGPTIVANESATDVLRALSAQLPGTMRDDFETIIKQAVESGLPPQVKATLPADFDFASAEAMLASTRDALSGKEQERPIKIRYYHCDHLGTPFALSDEKGQIVWRGQYDPWGNLIAEEGQIDQPIRFQGQHHDTETGLHYNRHRYYDPAVGAYITQDPIGFGGDLNFYQYASGNPLNNVDRLGLFGDGRAGSAYAKPDPNAPLGHSDFYGQKEFGLDFTKEDHGWTHPFLQPSRHFQPLEQSEKEANDAIKSCSKDGFERAMHRVQDYYSHYKAGYRWDPFNSSLPCNGFGHICKLSKPDDNPKAWALANDKTKEWVDRWRKCCS